MQPNLRCDGDRLWRSLMEMAEIGATPKGGSKRLTLTDEDRHGAVLGDELARIGYAGTGPVGGRPVGAYFELHIEQGPILENEGRTIGVVTAAQGQRWLEIEVTGRESHAGPTPMPVRRDALVVASGIVQEVNRIGHAYAPHACATVGLMEVSPNSRNVIPGHVFLTVDLCHPEGDALDAMDADLKTHCAKRSDETGVTVEVRDFWHFPSTPFDAVRRAAAQGYAHHDIISGAGHDAVYLARVAPAGMIFIPCEDGISHNETENATKADCRAGCDVLLSAVLETAGIVESP